MSCAGGGSCHGSDCTVTSPSTCPSCIAMVADGEAACKNRAAVPPIWRQPTMGEIERVRFAAPVYTGVEAAEMPSSWNECRGQAFSIYRSLGDDIVETVTSPRVPTHPQSTGQLDADGSSNRNKHDGHRIEQVSIDHEAFTSQVGLANWGTFRGGRTAHARVPAPEFSPHVGVSTGHWYSLCDSSSATTPLSDGAAICKVGNPFGHHDFGAAENTAAEYLTWGSHCYSACGIPDGDVDAMRSRGDAICMTAAWANGWSCGYAGDICARPSINPFGGYSDTCEVECEFGDLFQCALASTRRDANLERAGCRCCSTAFLRWSAEFSIAFPASYGDLLYAYCTTGTGSASGCSCFSQYRLTPRAEFPCERTTDHGGMFSYPWCR